MSPATRALRGAAGPLLALLVSACASTPRVVAPPPPPPVASAADAGAPTTASAQPPAPREAPPTVPPPRDVHLPAITRAQLSNGLETNVLEYHTLPVVHIEFMIRSAGTSADPTNLPGLAAFTGDMLKEGTRHHDSQHFADAVAFLGAELQVTTTQDRTVISLGVMREHAAEALALVAEMLTEPTFPPLEIARMQRREQDRLTQMRDEPRWLSTNNFAATIYGPDHPYNHLDTTPEALAHITRDALVAFHRTRFVAGSMVLTLIGDVRPAEIQPVLARTFARLPRGTAPAIRFPTPPEPAGRRVVIVDRPGSAQSDVRVGNLALRRADPRYVPLRVADQVLGGDPSSRLFVDLREHRSLGYGAYSHAYAYAESGTLQAAGSFRTESTADAVAALLENIERVVTEPVPEDELERARRFLANSFALSIDSPDDLATLVTDMRTYGLPDDYWDTYRSRIRAVDAAQLAEVARAELRPDRAVVVVVGDASRIEQSLQRFGPVRVVSDMGRTLRELPARP